MTSLVSHPKKTLISKMSWYILTLAFSVTSKKKKTTSKLRDLPGRSQSIRYCGGSGRETTGDEAAPQSSTLDFIVRAGIIVLSAHRAQPALSRISGFAYSV